jgi:hypothetical protein
MTAPGESLVVGDKVEVATNIARLDHELGGFSIEKIGSVQLNG